nr:MAG: hypothetical protein [Microvirus sp.]
MKRKKLSQYLRCVISYTDVTVTRTLHYAVSTDYVEDFTQMIKDTFVHPDISFTDIIYSYDDRVFFQLI